MKLYEPLKIFVKMITIHVVNFSLNISSHIIVRAMVFYVKNNNNCYYFSCVATTAGE